MSRTIVLSLYLLLRSLSLADPLQLGPVFVVEPPSLVQYPVSLGVKVNCVAKGNPTPVVSWLGDDGTTVADIAGVRRTYINGTLEILSSNSPGYRNGLGTTYKCRATNAHGTVLSRDVTLQPVSDEGWEAVLKIPTVLEGGVAVLTCGTSARTNLVQPAVWYHGDRVLNVETSRPDARYIISGNTLLIRDVTSSDAGSYSCLARHLVTGITKRSKSTYLTVTPGTISTAPRLIATTGEVAVSAGNDFCIPCVASGQPNPQYTWYKEISGRLQPIDTTTSPQTWLWSGGAALCGKASREVSGAWLCKAYNVFGDTTSQMRLEVRDQLTVSVYPSVHVANTGSSIRFNCTISDLSATVRWLHDGAPVGGSATELVVHGVARAHRGMYQCFARRGRDTAQAAGELRLGDTAPELHYTFIEQALRSGGSVSLRCAASGSPSPRFSWLLDGQPIDQFLATHRYSINEETSVNGDVISILNISAATAADGGRYTCKAQNTLGFITHSARLNIYGPPSIRALGPVRVVAGANATVFCPYAGYPISSISWWSRGAERAISNSGRVSARGQELRLSPALPLDAGPYACSVSAPDGTAARRDIELQVRNPPKISPFMFSSELTEGSSVQVLCGVSSGDKPIYFSWLKDGAPIPTTLQIQEKSLDEFSLLMFTDLTAKHSGEYTCRVSNHAATVNYSSSLSVKVAPSWSSEPLDAAVLLGAPISLECSAKGYPFPNITWFRKIGEGLVSTDGTTEQWEEIQSLDWGRDSLRANNGTLTATSATRSHQGTYRCKADNGVGPALLKHINVTVHEPAHFDINDGLNIRNVTCTRGQSASLNCHALGDAPLKVYWTHTGRRLDLNSFRATVSEIKTADGLRSVLQLRSAERNDIGEYRCHAENEYGRSELLMYLHVEEPPEAPRALRLGGTGSRWVRLSWRSHASQGIYFSAIYTSLHTIAGIESRQKTVNLTTEAINKEDRLDPDGTLLFVSVLNELRPATAYSLRIAASNHVGQSPQSEPLMFTTLEESPTGSPQNVRVRPTGNGELHVAWSAPPQESWNGELLGYVITWRELSRLDDDTNDIDDGRRAGSITSPGWSSSELTLNGLRKFSRYAVSVRAYNSAGAGPTAPTVYATTADGVPDASPSEVRCEPISSRSIRVRWSNLPGNRLQSIRGYDIQYAALHLSHSWSGALSGETARTGIGGEATLQGLRRATNYSISIRARSEAGLGPSSALVYCSTLEDVPGSPESVRALPISADGVIVSWLAPSQRGGKLTHYILYTRELGKPGAEWSQRVEIDELRDDAEGELFQEVRGLRERTVYEFWVRGSTIAGQGESSRSVTAAPNSMVTAKIASFGRMIRVAEGTRVRLRCNAVGTPPLSRNWKPLPVSHTLTETGDLLIHRVETTIAGNYTCSVRNSLGADATTYALKVLIPPASPAPRLTRAETNALYLTWDPPKDGGAPLLGYTLWWSRIDASDLKSTSVPESDTTYTLEGLACGAQYRVTLRAHNTVGASPHSRPLIVRTRGERAKAALGKEFVWANSTHLRFNLLAWSGRCPITSWAIAIRTASGGPWRNIIANGEFAEATTLRPGTWYEIRVVARSAAGDTTALYRAATHTHNGERLGEPIEVPMEASTSITGGTTEGIEGDDWRTNLVPAFLGGGLAILLASVAGLMLFKRKRGPHCLQRSCTLQQVCQPHPQLYTTEPGKRNGKTLCAPDADIDEISPYATFSMAGGANTGTDNTRCSSGCLLHLRTFGRAEALDLAAPPSRPNLLRHSGSESLLTSRTLILKNKPSAKNPVSRGLVKHRDAGVLHEYVHAKRRDTDSDSSGSPCAECAAEMYRVPAGLLPETLPVIESSAEDTSYSTSGGIQPPRGMRSANRGRRRREHTRHSSGPTARYFSNATLQARQEAL